MAVVRLSDEARDRWTEVARRYGVSVAALLEAMAPQLPDDDEPDLTPRAKDIIDHARRIDAIRRRRG